MSERKVLNKYYPPDFDPSKIPRMKLARNRQYTVRLMAPFNMRCKTCGEYIYKGKKFNARKEDVEGDDYLGIRIYRFYIKCTRCLQEISFKTDPKNTDYEIEAGATRNFMALKLAEEQAQREEDEEKEEEATNPMKLLEKRTQQSKQELELLESLEELKDLNRRQQTIDYDQMLQQFDTEAARQKRLKDMEERDERYVKEIFAKKNLTGMVVEEEIIEINEDEPPKKILKLNPVDSEATNSKTDCEKVGNPIQTPVAGNSWIQDTGIKSQKRNLSGLIRKKNDIGVKTNVQSIDNNKVPSSVENVSSSVTSNSVSEIKSKDATSNGLSLLGAYSNSSSDNDSD